MSSLDRGVICKEWLRTPGPRRGMGNYPWFVDAKGQDIIITERDGHRIQVFDTLGHVNQFYPFGRKGSSHNELLNPGGLTTTDIAGTELIVADSGNKRVTFYQRICDIYGYGTFQQMYCVGAQDLFSHPMSVEYDFTRRLLAVSDYERGKVLLFTMTRGGAVYYADLLTSRKVRLDNPVDIAIDALGYMYVTDVGTYSVNIFDPDRRAVCSFGRGILKKPWGICFDRHQNLLVADEGNDKILMFDRQGNLIKEVINNVPMPKGVAVTIRNQLVITTADPYNFLKLVNY